MHVRDFGETDGAQNSGNEQNDGDFPIALNDFNCGLNHSVFVWLSG